MKYILRAYFNDTYYVYLRKIGFTKVVTTRLEEKVLKIPFYWAAKLVCKYVNFLEKEGSISKFYALKFEVIGITNKKRKLEKF